MSGQCDEALVLRDLSCFTERQLDDVEQQLKSTDEVLISLLFGDRSTQLRDASDRKVEWLHVFFVLYCGRHCWSVILCFVQHLPLSSLVYLYFPTLCLFAGLSVYLPICVHRCLAASMHP